MWWIQSWKGSNLEPGHSLHMQRSCPYHHHPPPALLDVVLGAPTLLVQNIEIWFWFLEEPHPWCLGDTTEPVCSWQCSRTMHCQVQSRAFSKHGIYAAGWTISSPQCWSLNCQYWLLPGVALDPHKHFVSSQNNNDDNKINKFNEIKWYKINLSHLLM